jgi:hypothetical protein
LAVCLTLSSLRFFVQIDENLGTAVYVELLEKGFISGNVDFSIGYKSRLTLGLTMLDHEFAKEENQESYPLLTLPTPSIMYFYLFVHKRHYFEAGIGLSISPVLWREYSENDSALSLHGSLGNASKHPSISFSDQD